MRTKVRMGLIPNPVTRKATFKKRKKGFLKKCYELKTLCDVVVFAVIYNPYESLPVVWPNHLEARQVVSRYQNLPKTEKTKKMYDQNGMLKKRLDKALDQLKRKRKDYRHKEITLVANRCVGGWMCVDNIKSIPYLTDLKFQIEQNQVQIRNRLKTIEMKKTQETQMPPPASPIMQYFENEIAATVITAPSLPALSQPQLSSTIFGFQSYGDMTATVNYGLVDIWPSEGLVNGAFSIGGCVGGDDSLMMTLTNAENNFNAFWFSSFYN